MGSFYRLSESIASFLSLISRRLSFLKNLVVCFRMMRKLSDSRLYVKLPLAMCTGELVKGRRKERKAKEA